MKTNRRFPFERSNEKYSFENCSPSNDQLYSNLRQFISINRNRTMNQPRYNSFENVSSEDNHRLNQFIEQLKRECKEKNIDETNISSLREHNLQHWKHVRSQWEKYYHEENQKQQDLFDHIIKTSYRSIK